MMTPRKKTEMEPITGARPVIVAAEIPHRIAELRDEWQRTTGDNPDDYGLVGDDWLAGLNEEEAEEMVNLLELSDRLSRTAPTARLLIREDLLRDENLDRWVGTRPFLAPLFAPLGYTDYWVVIL